MNDTFTVYQLTLTEAGFKETTIPNCIHSGYTWMTEKEKDVICPDKRFIRHDNMEVAVYIPPRTMANYYSKNPDFSIGRKAILEYMKARIEKAKKAIETMENLLKYEKA